jgi:uncharacterized protein
MKEKRGARRVVWTSSDPPGIEFCRVGRVRQGWELTGTVARRLRGGLAVISYRVGTDRGWRTERVFVEQDFGGKSGTLDMEKEGSGWRVLGRRAGSLEGCIDVDLQVSPATNTLPLKRAGPGVGSKLWLKAAWVRFPSLKVQPLEQSYERLGEHRYLYRSDGFESEIEFDEFGLVRRYGDYWLAV